MEVEGSICKVKTFKVKMETGAIFSLILGEK